MQTYPVQSLGSPKEALEREELVEVDGIVGDLHRGQVGRCVRVAHAGGVAGDEGGAVGEGRVGSRRRLDLVEDGGEHLGGVPGVLRLGPALCPNGVGALEDVDAVLAVVEAGDEKGM